MKSDQAFDCLRDTNVALDIFPGYPQRFPVPENKKSWDIPYPEYQPPYYTSGRILKMTEEGRADSEDISTLNFHDAKYFSLDKLKEGYLEWLRHKPKDDPKQCDGFRLDEHGFPLNPKGRTGLRGRGACKHWGPIQAADALLTRLNPHTNQIEVLIVERADNGAMALPGGKVDPGEFHQHTALRELFEEAIELPQTTNGKSQFPFYFYNDETVFEGVCSDPRNTDNAWYESRVFHKHLPLSISHDLKLRASSDAVRVMWETVTPHLMDHMFASHGEILRYTLTKMAEVEKKICQVTTLERDIIRGAIELILKDTHSEKSVIHAA